VKWRVICFKAGLCVGISLKGNEETDNPLRVASFRGGLKLDVSLNRMQHVTVVPRRLRLWIGLIWRKIETGGGFL
jgi:hypothetical protein